MTKMPRQFLLALVVAMAASAFPAMAQDDARMKQLRLLCAQLSCDLTDPGGIAAFRRCLTTRDPLGEIKRDNNIGHVAAPLDRPDVKPPKGFGHDSRRALADGVQRFDTPDGKLFFAVDKDGTLWRWDSETKKTFAVDHKAASVRAIDADHLLILHADGTLWREAADGGGRAQLDRGVAEFQPFGADLVYVLGGDGDLWREPDKSNRALVDHTVKAFQALDASVVYVLGTDGKLWRETGDTRDRKSVASQVAGFQYVANGDTIYVLAADGSLWRKQGPAEAKQIDRGIAAFEAVDANLAFVLGGDGRLWRDAGDRDHAALVESAVQVAAGKGSFQVLDAAHVIVLGADHKLWAETMPGR
jgi:hypothetical protein